MPIRSSLPTRPSVQALREAARTSPRGALKHPALARLATVDPSTFIEIGALARTELASRALRRELERLTRRGRRLFLCEYTLSLLPVFQSSFPDWPYDTHVARRAIETAHDYALGRASATELRAADQAAWDAWSDAVPVAQDAPWNFCLNAIRAATPEGTWHAAYGLAFFRAQHAARNAKGPLWSAFWQLTHLAEFETQLALVRELAGRQRPRQ